MNTQQLSLTLRALRDHCDDLGRWRDAVARSYLRELAHYGPNEHATAWALDRFQTAETDLRDASALLHELAAL